MYFPVRVGEHGFLISVCHRCRTGNAGSHVEHLPLLVGIECHIARVFGARTDNAHLAAKHVHQLGKFIQFGTPQKVSCGGDALIPRQWWDEEQRRRTARVAKQQKRAMDPMYEPRRIGSRHLLSGLVFCGATDGEEHPMMADTVPEREGKRSRWDFYICSHKKNSREQKCTAQRVGAAALDESIIENLLTHVLTREHLRPIADALAESVTERNQDVAVRVTAVQARLDEVQKSISKLVDAVEKMGFSTSLQARLQEREDEERKLIAELVNLQDLLIKPKDIPKVTDAQLADWIEHIRQALTGDDIELARQAIRQFVAKIVVNGKAGTLYYTFPLSDLSRIHEVALTGLEPVFWP